MDKSSLMSLDIPDCVRAAIASLSDEDIHNMTQAMNYETGEFIGLGFVEHGVFTKPCNPDKVIVFDVIEKYLREEFDRLTK